MDSGIGPEGESRRRFRAVVVDDEPAGRAAVATFLAEVPSIDLVGEASDGSEAIGVIERTRPDLLFLDVQMPDRDGFTVLAELGDAVPRGVVLVTAHGEYAQRAFDVHAVDYVMKPFGRPRFMAAVERALRRLAAEEALDMTRTLRSLVESLRLDRRERAGEGATLRPAVGPASPGDAPSAGSSAGGTGSSGATSGGAPPTDPGEEPTPPARIGVRLGSRTTLVDVDEIDWIEADGDLVRLHVGDRVHLLQSRMRDLEAMLGAAGFLRIHRSAIVNQARIDVLHREADGGGSVSLDTGVRLRVARGRWEELEAALGLGTD